MPPPLSRFGKVCSARTWRTKSRSRFRRSRSVGSAVAVAVVQEVHGSAGAVLRRGRPSIRMLSGLDGHAQHQHNGLVQRICSPLRNLIPLLLSLNFALGPK
jgi:hypothetical protein